jgi:hypothetical protein
MDLPDPDQVNCGQKMVNERQPIGQRLFRIAANWRRQTSSCPGNCRQTAYLTSIRSHADGPGRYRSIHEDSATFATKGLVGLLFHRFHARPASQRNAALFRATWPEIEYRPACSGDLTRQRPASQFEQGQPQVPDRRRRKVTASWT